MREKERERDRETKRERERKSEAERKREGQIKRVALCEKIVMAGGRAEGTLTASLRPRSKNIKKTEPETNDNIGQAGVGTYRPFTLLFFVNPNSKMR